MFTFKNGNDIIKIPLKLVKESKYLYNYNNQPYLTNINLKDIIELFKFIESYKKNKNKILLNWDNIFNDFNECYKLLNIASHFKFDLKPFMAYIHYNIDDVPLNNNIRKNIINMIKKCDIIFIRRKCEDLNTVNWETIENNMKIEHKLVCDGYKKTSVSSIPEGYNEKFDKEYSDSQNEEDYEYRIQI